MNYLDYVCAALALAEDAQAFPGASPDDMAIYASIAKKLRRAVALSGPVSVGYVDVGTTTMDSPAWAERPTLLQHAIELGLGMEMPEWGETA